jgi:hypothetical protein
MKHLIRHLINFLKRMIGTPFKKCCICANHFEASLSTFHRITRYGAAEIWEPICHECYIPIEDTGFRPIIGGLKIQ